MNDKQFCNPSINNNQECVTMNKNYQVYNDIYPNNQRLTNEYYTSSRLPDYSKDIRGLGVPVNQMLDNLKDINVIEKMSNKPTVSNSNNNNNIEKMSTNSVYPSPLNVDPYRLSTGSYYYNNPQIYSVNSAGTPQYQRHLAYPKVTEDNIIPFNNTHPMVSDNSMLITNSTNPFGLTSNSPMPFNSNASTMAGLSGPSISMASNTSRGLASMSPYGQPVNNIYNSNGIRSQPNPFDFNLINKTNYNNGFVQGDAYIKGAQQFENQFTSFQKPFDINEYTNSGIQLFNPTSGMTDIEFGIDLMKTDPNKLIKQSDTIYNSMSFENPYTNIHVDEFGIINGKASKLQKYQRRSFPVDFGSQMNENSGVFVPRPYEFDSDEPYAVITRSPPTLTKTLGESERDITKASVENQRINMDLMPGPLVKYLPVNVDSVGAIEARARILRENAYAKEISEYDGRVLAKNNGKINYYGEDVKAKVDYILSTRGLNESKLPLNKLAAKAKAVVTNVFNKPDIGVYNPKRDIKLMNIAPRNMNIHISVDNDELNIMKIGTTKDLNGVTNKDKDKVKSDCIVIGESVMTAEFKKNKLAKDMQNVLTVILDDRDVQSCTFKVLGDMIKTKQEHILLDNDVDISKMKQLYSKDKDNCWHTHSIITDNTMMNKFIHKTKLLDVPADHTYILNNESIIHAPKLKKIQKAIQKINRKLDFVGSINDDEIILVNKIKSLNHLDKCGLVMPNEHDITFSDNAIAINNSSKSTISSIQDLIPVASKSEQIFSNNIIATSRIK